MAREIETKCIHLEEKEDSIHHYGAMTYPIYQTATYAHPGVGQSTGYDYSRLQNPTKEHLEKTVASLENGIDALAFSSGMAAITLMMELFKPGDHLIVDADLYGGSIRLFNHVSEKNGIEFSSVDCYKENVAGYIRENTKAVYIETPTNPMMNVTDIKALGVRMDHAQENAIEIAKWLKKQDIVEKVIYPGFEEHPGYEIMKKQARGFGAMLTFELTKKEYAFEILENVKMIKYAESLGGVETLITYPATQTHADVPEEIRVKNGITDCVLRMSVGIENIKDLLNELEQVFAKVRGE